MIRDRDGKFPDLFDAVLADAGITVVLTGIRMPRMNAIAERWIETCRRELLDRTLIWNQHHLLHSARIRSLLQPPPAPPRHRERPPAASTTAADHRPRPNRPPERTTTPTPGRNPQRVRTCRLTCTDEIVGKDNVQTGVDGNVDEFRTNTDGSLTRIGSVTVPDAEGAEGIVAV